MSQSNNNPKTLLSGEALAAHRLVKLSGSTVVYADAGEQAVGVTNAAYASGAHTAFDVINKEGTVKVTASGAISAGAAIFPAADGKITATPNGASIGFALEAATADDDVIECVLGLDLNMLPFAGRTIAVITDDTTISAATDTGKIYACATDAKTLTLPATAVGLEFGLVNIGADGAAGIAVDFNASDKNLGGCGVAAGGDGKKLTNTKATAKRGDFILLRADGTDGYYIVAYRGTWAQEA